MQAHDSSLGIILPEIGEIGQQLAGSLYSTHKRFPRNFASFKHTFTYSYYGLSYCLMSFQLIQFLTFVC